MRYIAQPCEPPKYPDGRLIKHVTRFIRWACRARRVPRYETLPDGCVIAGRVPNWNGAYVVRPWARPFVRFSLWADWHRWDAEEWLYRHGLMFMNDGDWYANAKWRFPWRKLPSVPRIIAGKDEYVFRNTYTPI